MFSICPFIILYLFLSLFPKTVKPVWNRHFHTMPSSILASLLNSIFTSDTYYWSRYSQLGCRSGECMCKFGLQGYPWVATIARHIFIVRDWSMKAQGLTCTCFLKLVAWNSCSLIEKKKTNTICLLVFSYEKLRKLENKFANT